jgi:hypothetical protein
MDWSSSTIQIGFMRLPSRPFGLTVHGNGIRILKSVRPGTLSHSISAMVLLHEGLRQRQPQP